MKDLFGNEIPQPLKPGKKPANAAAVMAHFKLINIYGSVDDKCKNCKHFIIKRYGGTYFKCAKFSVSGSMSSDWRANWKACGLFVKDQND